MFMHCSAAPDEPLPRLSNRVDLFVFGNDERMVVVARLDNLGKGASGAAVQSMNIHLGVEESLGLV